MDSKVREKFKILLISNNPLSKIENNGKTLLSYFNGWEQVSLMQIWFRPELPDAICVSSEKDTMTFFQLTDRMALQHQSGRMYVFSRKDEDLLHTSSNAPKVSSFYSSPFRMSALVKLLRELPWKLYNFEKHNKFFVAQLQSNKPDAIFFCGGDAVFAYQIAGTLAKILEIPLILYITDDYILPYRNLSLFSRYRRFLLRNVVLRTAQKAAKIFTIGTKMQKTYSELYGFSSTCLVNISEDHYSPFEPHNKHISESGKPWEIVFVGGLHYGRDRSLHNVITAIEQINQELNHKLFNLSIYSYTHISDKKNNAFNTSCSSFMGRIGAKEVESTLKAADILLFVESSDNRAVKSTALSLSTKVPEYQSYNRPIITVGSIKSASVAYLRDYSIYAQDSSMDIYRALKEIAEKPEKLYEWAKIAYANFQTKHQPDQVKSVFRKEMIEVMNCHED